jgi:hypothetical protein
MLLWIEGFERFGTSIGAAPLPTGVVGRKYSAIGNEGHLVTQAGRLGGYSLQLVWDSTCYVSPAALTTNATMIVGCAINFKTFAAGMFLGLYDGTTAGMNLYMNTSGEISVRRGSTVLATTSGLGLATNAWYYLEFKVLCNSSTGTYELRLSGNNVLSATGVNTKAGTDNYHTTFRLVGLSGGGGITAGCVIDDLYCCDGAGSTNNNFLGNVKVVAIRPDAAGDSTQFTPDSGSNYQRLSEIVCDDDTSYVQSANTSDRDLYNYSALTNMTANIHGIQINTDCRETDANSFTLKTPCKSNATVNVDAGITIGSTNYTTKTRILEVDPDTANAWTVNGVNAVQVGVEVG